MKEKTLINFKEYAELLKESLEKNGIISEDTARYLLFACVINKYKLKGKETIKILQEVPYTDKKRLNAKTDSLKGNAKLDSFYDLGKEKYAIEFKFHRIKSATGKKRDIPHTVNAGRVFNDINRLSLIDKNIHKYFIYLTDEGMLKYKNGKEDASIFRKIFNQKDGVTKTIKQKQLKNEQKTFVDKAYSSFKTKDGLKDIKVTMIKSISIKEDKYCLMVLEVNK